MNTSSLVIEAEELSLLAWICEVDHRPVLAMALGCVEEARAQTSPLGEGACFNKVSSK